MAVADSVQWTAVRKGAVVGLVAGAVSGIILGAVYCDGYDCAGTELLFALGLGGAGAAIGAGVGALQDARSLTPFGRTSPGVAQLASPRTRRVLVSWRF